MNGLLLASSRRGDLHAIWGELAPGSREVRGEPMVLADRLMYSHLSGGRWARPEVVFSGPGNIAWTGSSAPRPKIDSQQRLHFTARAIPDRSGGSRVLYFVGTPGAWTVAEPTFADVGGIVYSDVVPLSRTDVLLAFIAGSLRHREANTNSVWVARSVDGGASFGPARLVSYSGALPASRVRIVATSPSEVHLFFDQSQRTGGWPGSVLHAISRDAGLTWSSPAPAFGAQGTGFLHSTEVYDPSIGLHLLAAFTDGTVFHSTWMNGAWTPTQRFMAPRHVRHLSTFDAAVVDDSLLLVLGGGDRNAIESVRSEFVAVPLRCLKVPTRNRDGAIPDRFPVR